MSFAHAHDHLSSNATMGRRVLVRPEKMTWDGVHVAAGLSSYDSKGSISVPLFSNLKRVLLESYWFVSSYYYYRISLVVGDEVKNFFFNFPLFTRARERVLKSFQVAPECQRMAEEAFQ